MYRKSEKFPGGTLSGDNLGIFLKGSVIGLTNEALIETIDKGKFYVVTNNQDVIKELSNNTPLKCEFKYLDEFSDVESMVGYMYKLVEDGVVIPSSFVDINDHNDQVIYDCDYYKSTSKQRAGIGFTDDGKIVLLTTNTKKGGPTQYEVGQMFKGLGCNNAYQFDGGGSVTFIKRNNEGNLEMLNTPGDGVIRSIMSGLFIVTKAPGFIQNIGKSTSTSIYFEKDNSDFGSSITDAIISYNGKTFKEEDGVIKVSGLKPNTDYVLEVSYLENNIRYNAEIKASTRLYNPGIYFTSLSNGFEVSINENDDVLKLKEVIITINDENYKVTDLKELVINDLTKDFEYEVSYKYTYENTDL